MRYYLVASASLALSLVSVSAGSALSVSEQTEVKSGFNSFETIKVAGGTNNNNGNGNHGIGQGNGNNGVSNRGNGPGWDGGEFWRDDSHEFWRDDSHEFWRDDSHEIWRDMDQDDWHRFRDHLEKWRNHGQEVDWDFGFDPDKFEDRKKYFELELRDDLHGLKRSLDKNSSWFPWSKKNR